VQAHALTYAFLDPAILSHHGGGAGASPAARGAAGIAAHAYTVHFERANARVRLTAETPTAGERNYFVGADARRWARHVGAFRRVRYTNLWPGVDLTLYENAQRHLEYDVLLAPRADPARVALRYDGAAGLALDAAGNLVVKTSVGTTTELAPKAWQVDAAGRRQAVACQYVLTGRTVSFALGRYDNARALTIDPTVQFSTLTGSTADNWGFTAAYDNAGNLYSGGIVFVPAAPTPPPRVPIVLASAAWSTWRSSSTTPPLRTRRAGVGHLPGRQQRRLPPQPGGERAKRVGDSWQHFFDQLPYFGPGGAAQLRRRYAALPVSARPRGPL
jgi:hypothetical protein